MAIRQRFAFSLFQMFFLGRAQIMGVDTCGYAL
jgi:hypothetical protein